MLDVVARWNRWGSATLPGRKGRDATAQVVRHLDAPEILALVGPRRAGKTTILFQILDHLEASGVPRQAVLHLNLEEPALAPEAGPELLERAYRAWREAMWPTGRAYVLLDEVQAVPGWERWVRARHESEDVRLIVTGSSSALLGRELGGLLTGRHLTFQIHPLSFAEFLRFRGVEVPAVGESPAVGHALIRYLADGALPEVALTEDAERRRLLLTQYVDDVIYRDIALRHGVRHVAALRGVAVALLTQTAALFTYQRVARTHGISVDTARSWVEHLAEAFLVDPLPFASLHAGERSRQPQKLHAVDTGLRNAVTLHPSADAGRVAETAVVGALRRAGHRELGWWKGRGEVDVVVQRAGGALALVQVCVEGSPAREQAALDEAAATFPGAAQVVVGPAGVPLWRFLLDPGAFVPS